MRKFYFLFFLLLFIVSECKVIAQDKRVFIGTVKDISGNPLANVSVKAINTNQGTFTSNAGTFKINIDASVKQLKISYIGYLSQIININDSNNLSVVLIAENNNLNDVIVVGYGKQRKGDIIGSVDAVDIGKINSVPLANLSNGLAGRAAGVVVASNSGLAGSSSNLSIRGSFNQPLYVIDGVVKDQAAFDALDPNEIDQLNILKDAAAASVYGAQAGGGVVVITTKKGALGKPSVLAQVSTTTERPTQTMLADQSNATDELTYQNNVTEYENEHYNAGLTLPNGPEEFNYFKNRSYNINDWIWRNPGTQKYLLSVSGGTDKISYYNMISYTGENGSYQNLSYKKFNLRSNVTAKINDDISLNLNVAAFQQNTDRFYWPENNSDNLADYDVADFYRTTFNWPKYVPPYLEADGTPAKPGEVTPYPILPNYGSFLGWSVADVVQGNNRYIRARNRQINPTLTLDVKLDKLTQGLSAKFLINYEANDFFQKSLLNYSTSYIFNPAPGQNNPFLPAPPDPNQTSVFTFNGPQAPYLSENMNTGWKYQLDGYLTYDRKFGQHSINAVGVFEQTEQKAYALNATAYDPVTNIDQYFVYSSSSGNRFGDGNESVSSGRSFIGRLHYDFTNKYIAEFSFREDGRYEFAPGHQWGFFPSGSIAWRISKESFLSNSVSWINDLKLRASYGTTGNLYDVNNNPIAGYQYQTYYGNSGGYIFGNTYNTGIAPAYTPNPNITWATTIEKNIGLDFTLLKNRLSGSIDIFQNVMNNILGPRTVTLPTTYGQTLAPENYAKRTFHGWEYSIQWQDKIGTVSYGINANMGYAIDEWEKLDQNALYGPGGAASFENAIGHPANRIFGLEAEGLIRTQDQLNALIKEGYNYRGQTPYLGAILYKDVRGQNYSSTPDHTIDGNDVVLLSNNAIPRINFGFGFNASWRGLSLDAHFQGVLDYERMISIQEGAGIYQWGGTQRAYYPIWTHDVYTPETPDGKYPRPTGELSGQAGEAGSSFWLRNGDYLRLKNLNLAYTFPAKWMNKAGLTGTQIFVNGTDLFTFSKVKEFMDPEQQYYDSYPIMKTFTIGLNVKF